MKAHELLATPEKWCQGSYGRDADGRSCGNDIVNGEAGDAVCFCLEGALFVCYGGPDESADERRRVADRIGTKGLINWNDTESRTHAEVLAVLRELDI